MGVSEGARPPGAAVEGHLQLGAVHVAASQLYVAAAGGKDRKEKARAQNQSREGIGETAGSLLPPAHQPTGGSLLCSWEQCEAAAHPPPLCRPPQQLHRQSVVC